MLHATKHTFTSSPAEQAKSLKDEGNEYFKEKNYKKAIVSYTAGLKKNSTDSDLNAILYTNRAAAHFHLGEDISLIVNVVLVMCGMGVSYSLGQNQRKNQHKTIW